MKPPDYESNDKWTGLRLWRRPGSWRLPNNDTQSICCIIVEEHIGSQTMRIKETRIIELEVDSNIIVYVDDTADRM